MFKDLLNQTPHKQIERVRKTRRELTKKVFQRFAEKGNVQDSELNQEVSKLLLEAEEIDPDYHKRRNPYSDLRWYLHCWKSPVINDGSFYTEKAEFIVKFHSLIHQLRQSVNRFSHEERMQFFWKGEGRGELQKLESIHSRFEESIKNWLISNFSNKELSDLFPNNISGLVGEMFTLTLEEVISLADKNPKFRKIFNEAIDAIFPDHIFYSWKNQEDKYAFWMPNPDDFKAAQKQDTKDSIGFFPFEKLVSYCKETVQDLEAKGLYLLTQILENISSPPEPTYA